MNNKSMRCLASKGFGKINGPGVSSVLVSSGEETDFIYEVTGSINAGIADAFNALSLSFKDRFALLTKHNCGLRYTGMYSATFHDNLVLIDSYLPEMVGYALLLYYSDGLNNVADIVERMTVDNPMRYDLTNGHPFYSYKFKKFLTACALGMTPCNVWNGKVDMYVTLKGAEKTCEFLGYYFLGPKGFEDYLLNNAKFATSCCSGQEFGSIYKDTAKYHLKLSLQMEIGWQISAT